MPDSLPILLAVHLLMALGLLLPSLLVPFTLTGRDPAAPLRTMSRALLWAQGPGSLLLGAGAAATGLGLLVLVGPRLLGQPWLLLALIVYAANLGAAFFLQRPNLRTLLDDAAGPRNDAAAWRAAARRRRYVSYLMATAIGAIAYLMSAKPVLW